MSEKPPIIYLATHGETARSLPARSATLVTFSMLTSGHAAMWSMIGVGLFNSIMFPSIFALGVAELGPLTGSGSGLMNMAIVGGAIIPVLQGAIADQIGIHHAFLLPVICYLYILFYVGQRVNAEQRTAQKRPGKCSEREELC